MDVKRELALLRARPGKERAELLTEPPRRATRKQAEILRAMAAAGGTIAAEEVHYRTGLVLTARRWARLHQEKGTLAYALTPAGRSLLDGLDRAHQ